MKKTLLETSTNRYFKIRRDIIKLFKVKLKAISSLHIVTKYQYKFDSRVITLVEDILHLLPVSCKEKLVWRSQDLDNYFSKKNKFS